VSTLIWISFHVRERTASCERNKKVDSCDCAALRHSSRLNDKQGQPNKFLFLVLLFCFGSRFSFGFSFPLGYGLAFCSTNFRKERLRCGWSRYLAQQQSSSCDLASINRVPRIIVLAD
jgi:hypothetical protein